MTKEVPNPYDTERTSLLIDVDALIENLEVIQCLSETSERSTPLEVVAERNCLICGVEIKSKPSVIGHISMYCDEHDPSKVRSRSGEW